jgi:Ca-activated chloride channel family protein
VADRDNAEVGTLEVNIRVPEKKDVPRRRKAVQVMLDVSGSMSGHYEQWARRILDDLIASLADDDLIHILAFDHRCEVFSTTEHGFVPATRASKQSLRNELTALRAGGGTELTQAFKVGGAALAMLDDLEDSADIERIALLITDGAYGDESQAVAHREKEFKGARVIAVGIGENANGFLKVLAANGICVFVSSQQGVAEASAKVMSRVATAAHSHAKLIVEGLTNQAPALAPDIYPDVVVTLSGRMPRPADDATVEVIADDGHILTLPITISTDASSTTRWAKQHISSLDYRIMSSDFEKTGMDSHDALEAQIVAMSIKYRVLSKYTAWLAVDRSRTTDQVITQKLVQPQIDYIDDLRLTSVLRHSSVSPMSVGLKLSGSMARPASSFHDHFLNPDVSEAMSKLRSIASMKQLPSSEFPNAVLALIAEIDQYLSASPADDRDQMLSNVRTASLVLLSTFSKRIIGKRLSAELETALQSVMLDVNSHTDQTNLILSNLRDALSGHSSLKKTRTQRRR